MANQKTKIIIPSNLLKVKYNKLMPANYEHETDQLKLFQNENAEYVLTLNQKPSSSKSYDRVSAVGGTWNYLNVLGDFTINIENIDTLSLSFPPHDRGSYYISDYSGHDIFKSKKLTINSKGSVNLRSYAYSKENLCPLEELVINTRSSWVDLADLRNLKTLKLNAADPRLYEFRIGSMPNLEVLDLSGIKDIFANNFRIQEVSNKCKLILNPELKIGFFTRSVIDTNDLKSIVSWGDMEREPNDRDAVPISTILGLTTKPDKPIEISLIDFKEHIMNYSNMLTADRFIKEKHNQARAVETMRRRMNMSKEEIIKEEIGK